MSIICDFHPLGVCESPFVTCARLMIIRPLLAEFVAVMSRKVNASYTAEQVKSAFKVRAARV